MIKQTRGAIRFLLADYHAVLKYAMIAAAGIALSSPSYAGNEEGVGGSSAEQEQTPSVNSEKLVIKSDTPEDEKKFSEDKDFGKQVEVQQTTLTLAGKDNTKANYTAKSVAVTSAESHVGGLVVDNATLKTTEGGISVNGKLVLKNAEITAGGKEQPTVSLYGTGAEAAFSGKVTINGDLSFEKRDATDL